jgi:hypothetical protein
MLEPKNRMSWMDAVVTVASVGGGCGGIVSCLLILMGIVGPSIMQVIGIAVILSLYALGVTSGLLQYANPFRSTRLFKSYLIAQIPILKTFAFSYKLYSLASISIVLHPDSRALDFGGQLGSDWQLSVFHPASEIGYGINLVPVLLLGVLWRFLQLRAQTNNRVPEQAGASSAK